MTRSLHAADATAASLLDVPLTSIDGTSTALRAFVGPAVVVFVRHFGCIFCRERAAEVRGHAAAIAAARARIVFVGTGTAPMAAAFAREHADGLPVLGDPTKRVFELAGMRRGLGTVLRFGMVRNLLRALRRGHRQTKVQGDPWQQGGVLVLDGNGAVVHRQVDRAAGDAIDWARVVAAIPGR